jgi:hypothetical protein
MSGRYKSWKSGLPGERLDLGRCRVRELQRQEGVTPSIRLAENHGFAAENSCCPVRNPAADAAGVTTKLAVFGTGGAGTVACARSEHRS